MKRLALVAAVLAGALAGRPAAADVLPGSNFVSGNWTGAAYDTNKRFSHCAMNARYQSGITMLFSVSDNGSWRIGWQHSDWRLTQGQNVPVTYWIDTFPPRQVTAQARATTLAVAELPAQAEIFEQFRHGYMLYVTAEGRRYQFNLAGTQVALTRLADCVRQQRQIAGLDSTPPGPQAKPPVQQPAPPVQQQPPPPVPPPQAPPPAQAPGLPRASLEQRVEAIKVVANMLAQSEMGGFHILSDSEVKAINNAYLSNADVVWQGPGVFGVLRIVPASVRAGVDQVASAILAEDSRACTGTYASGFTNDDTGGGAKRMFTACETPLVRLLLRYTVVSLADGSVYVFATTGRQGDQANREVIEQADAALRKAVHTVLQR